MNISLHLSLYWLLAPLALLLTGWVAYHANREGHGMLSGLGTLFVFFAACGIFVVALCILLVIHLYKATHP